MKLGLSVCLTMESFDCNKFSSEMHFKRQTISCNGRVNSRLVKKRGDESKNYPSGRRAAWLKLGPILALGLLTLIGNAEAKTHLLKRQAPNNNQQQNLGQTGRENTNWWNLWWQQYIDEAVQPTVRPIVGVTFNGKSINLDGDREQRRDVDTNLVEAPGRGPSEAQRRREEDLAELERNEGFNSANSMRHSPEGTKQEILMAQKLRRQQSDWQSPSAGNRMNEFRNSRQALENQQRPLGIQMRQSARPQQQESRMSEQQQQALVEFEQQQNQMLDYSEDNEADLENLSNTGSGDGDRGNQIGATDGDSSSSSMLMKQDEPKRQRQGGASEFAKPDRNSKMMDSSTGRSSNDSRVEQATQQSTTTFTTTTTVSSSARELTTTTTPTSTVAAVNQPTTTAAADQSMSTTTATSASKTTSGFEVREETPISMDQLQQMGARMAQQQPQQQQAGGRVELMNGRPTSGSRQQQAAQSTARLPSQPKVVSDPPVATTTKTVPKSSTKASATMTTTATSSGSASSQPSTSTTSQPSQSTKQDRQESGASSGRQPSQKEAAKPVGRPEVAPSTASPMEDPMTIVSNSDGTGEAGEENEDEDSESSANGSGSNLSNSAGSGEESGEDEESSTDSSQDDPQDQNATTTTVAPTTTEAQQRPEQPAGRLTSQSSAKDPATVPPSSMSMTVVDIERLPKEMMRGGGQRESSSASQMSREPAATTQATTTAASAATTKDLPESGRPETELARIRNSSSEQSAGPKFVMMTLDPERGATTIDGETSITVPMDALMRMMMNQLAMEEGERKPSEGAQTPASLSTVTRTPSNQDARTQAGAEQQSPTTRLPATTTTTITTTTTAPASSGSAQQMSGKLLVPSDEQTTTRRPPSSSSVGPVQRENVGAQQQGAKKAKLQPPPPTTKMPTSSNKLAPATTTTLGASTGAPSQEFVRQEPQSTQKSSMSSTAMPEGESMENVVLMGGDGEKIEMINMDLMPIQRIMNNQRPNGAPMEPEQKRTPTAAMSGNGQQIADSQLPTTMVLDNNQFVMMEVEPGMRLRPLNGGGAGSGDAQAGPSRMVAPSNTNQANTVYMIMMNPNQGGQEVAQAHSKKPQAQQQTFRPSTKMPQTSTSSMARQSVKTTPVMLERLTAQPQLNGNTPSGGGAIVMRTTPSVPSSSSSITSPQTTIKMAGAIEQQQSTVTMGPLTTTTGRPTETTKTAPERQPQTTVMENVTGMGGDQNEIAIVNNNNMQVDMRRVENQKSSPGSEEPVTGNGDQMRQQPVMMILNQRPSLSEQEAARATNLPNTSVPSTGSPESFAKSSAPATGTTPNEAIGTATTITTQATTTKSASQLEPNRASIMRQQDAQQFASSSSPSSSGSGDSVSFAMSTVSMADRDRVRQQQQQLTNTSTTSTPKASQAQEPVRQPSSQSANQAKFDRIQSPTGEMTGSNNSSAGVKRPQPTKTGAPQGGKSNNATLSFIPTRLRTDFNKQSTPPSQQQGTKSLVATNQIASTTTTTTTTSTPTNSPSAQNLAIRQFGGANRMSALANGQPVPFGRPAAMTMQSAAKFSRLELPVFEYGPPIALRRPDEPLANGQVPNCTLTGKNFCVLTKDYPMNEVRQAVERSFRSVRIMYEELQTVSDQELHKDDFNTTNNQAASGKFACQTQVEMMRPGWAKDEITKEWMLVVNTDVFPQRVRTESCAQPNTPCEFIAPFYDSTCQQRYSLHRMIAIDPHDPSRSPQVAVFKFPAGCVCRVHPIRKSIMQMTPSTTTSTQSPSTMISSSTSKSIRRR